MSKITSATVRMYRMGTGDCFIVKFYAGKEEKYKMMIDCGTWKGSKDHLEPYVVDLKAYVNNHVDLLVITHEHKDHVYVFEACKELFTKDFKVDKVWMGWTENDKTKKVKDWQEEHGQKKMALALASQKLQGILTDPAYREQLKTEYNGLSLLESQTSFAGALDDFNALHNSAVAGQYVGGLKGMEIVKKTIGKNNIEYFRQGDIINDIPQLNGINFYVLGPPNTWEEAKKEAGGKGESYQNNSKANEMDAFAAAVLADTGLNNDALFPFDDSFVSNDPASISSAAYNSANNQWRRIDVEWLNSSANLALRVNSITNNLSLVLAIEFEDSGRVMLFPGDAEYGSWESWHKIDWKVQCRNKKPHFTHDLLSRTVFYKVAHHLSHNGTADRLGMSMMDHKDLAAMATLDYNVIAPGWTGTMPNGALLKQLLKQTKGRLIVMSPDELYYDHPEDTIPLNDQVKKERKKMNAKELKEFKTNFTEHPLFFEYAIKG